MDILRGSNEMTFKKYEKVPVDNWEQPWDCTKACHLAIRSFK